MVPLIDLEFDGDEQRLSNRQIEKLAQKLRHQSKIKRLSRLPPEMISYILEDVTEALENRIQTMERIHTQGGSQN